MLAKAIAIAAKAFENKTDKAGRPYILHCLRIMNAVNQKDEQLMCAAVLHDIVEDCPQYDGPILLAMGFSCRVVGAVDKLTHHKKLYVSLLRYNV